MPEQKSKKIPVKSAKKSKDKTTDKKTPSENEGSALASIYRQDHRQKIDMTRLERKKLSKKKLLIYFVVMLLVMFAVVSIAGFFIFNRGQGRTENDIKLAISAPKTVASGEEIELEITYLNQDKVAVKEADLTILYPDGFYFSHSDPQAQNEAHTFWKLGEIASGAGGRVKIYGQVIGEIDVTKTFQVSLSYTPVNFSSVFEEKEAYSLEITSSIVDLSLGAPLRIVSGQDTEIKIQYKNNSELALSNLKIMATYPEGFSLKETDPKPQEGQHSWLVDKLSKKEEGTITLHGIFQGEPGETKEFSVQLGLILEDGEFRLQAEKSALVFLVKPELNLQLTVNESNQELVTDLGDPLEFKVTYQNASEVELKNIVLKAEFVSEADILDFSRITDPQNGKIEEKTITWEAAEIPEFSSLVPQAEGEFSFTIPTYSTLSPREETDRNFSVTSSVKVFSMETEEIKGNFEKMSESNQVKISINSKVNLEAEGRYYSEEFEKLGSGPLPPEVGETTVYRIFWSVSNLYNDIEDVELTTVLPKDVFWTGRASSGTGDSLSFDPADRRVTWKINRLPANTGQLFPVAESSFEVSITPKAKQEGKLMVLTNESELQARDSFTNQDISISDNLITTDLENDVAAQERGIVVPKGTNKNLNLNQNLNENINTNTNSNSNSNLNES